MADDSSAQLQKQAIEAALNCEWEKALELNTKILEIEPENPDCMNRLAKAHCELGNFSEAKKIYELVLKLDAYNTIAQKNFKKVSSYKKNGSVNHNGNYISLSPSLFLQEPGVTKIVNLIKVAEPNKLIMLSTGMMVNLNPKNRGISVTDQNNQYVGALPDDIAFHISKLVKGGNKYQAFIKSIKPNGVTIIIREVFRSKKFKNQPSFLDETRVSNYSSDNIHLFSQIGEDEVEESPDGEMESI